MIKPNVCKSVYLSMFYSGAQRQPESIPESRFCLLVWLQGIFALVKVSIKIVHVDAIYCSRIECIRYSFHPCSNRHSTPTPEMSRNKAVEREIPFISHQYESLNHPYFMSNQNGLICFEFRFTLRGEKQQKWEWDVKSYVSSSEHVSWKSQNCQRFLPELDEVCVHGWANLRVNRAIVPSNPNWRTFLLSVRGPSFVRTQLRASFVNILKKRDDWTFSEFRIF